MSWTVKKTLTTVKKLHKIGMPGFASSRPSHLLRNHNSGTLLYSLTMKPDCEVDEGPPVVSPPHYVYILWGLCIYTLTMKPDCGVDILGGWGTSCSLPTTLSTTVLKLLVAEVRFCWMELAVSCWRFYRGSQGKNYYISKNMVRQDSWLLQWTYYCIQTLQQVKLSVMGCPIG